MEQMCNLNEFKMSFRSSKRVLLVSCRKQTLLQLYGEIVMSTPLHEFQMMYIKIETAEIQKPRNAFLQSCLSIQNNKLKMQ